MSYTLDNISDWVNVLKTKPRFSQFRTYSIVAAHNELQKKEQSILEVLHIADRIGGKLVHLVGDDMAVVEFIDHANKMTYFIPYVDGMTHSTEWFLTFDRALLAAVSLKYTSSVEGGRFAAKMLEVPECVVSR